jgi:purine-binding chemotaxis protein CheW
VGGVTAPAIMEVAGALDEGALLIFGLDDDAFAIGVGAVHEILDAQTPTPVPNADPFAPGVINVRGAVVPVLDIRRRLEMRPAEFDARARLIVVEVDIGGVAQKLAFAADAVENVVDVDLSTLRPVPELGAVWPQIYLRGSLRLGGRLVVLLDVETLFHPAPSIPE